MRFPSAREIWGRGRFASGDAKRAPSKILFGQMREDSEIEYALLKETPGDGPIVAIASAGCTAFTLAPLASRTFALDINPAQVALCRFKKRIIESANHAEIINAFEENAQPAFDALRTSLDPADIPFLEGIRQTGLQRCGLIDRRLRFLSATSRLVLSTSVRRRLFEAETLELQQQIFREEWATPFWNFGLRFVTAPAILGLVYGNDFIHLLPDGFQKGIILRLEEALLRLPARENPFLAQLFLNRYWPPHAPVMPRFLQEDGLGVLRQALPHLTFACENIEEWLETQPTGSIRFFALSNILDVADPAFATRVWNGIGRAAAPGCRVVLRSMFQSPAFWAKSHPFLKYDAALSVESSCKDRSGFCSLIGVFEVDAISPQSSRPSSCTKR